MKCPLLAHKTYIQDDYPIQVYEDCLKEECAWWGDYVFSKDKRIGCCALAAIALALSDIMNKMPHEKQFRK